MKRSAPAVVLMFFFVVALGALIVLFNGGQPRTPWFYPFLLGLALILALYGRRARTVAWTKGDVGPVQPVPTATKLALAAGAEAGATVFVMFGLGTSMPNSGLVSTVGAIIMGVNEYRFRRGLKYRPWPFILISAGLLLLGLMLVQFRIIRR